MPSLGSWKPRASLVQNHLHGPCRDLVHSHEALHMDRLASQVADEILPRWAGMGAFWVNVDPSCLTRDQDDQLSDLWCWPIDISSGLVDPQGKFNPIGLLDYWINEWTDSNPTRWLVHDWRLLKKKTLGKPAAGNPTGVLLTTGGEREQAKLRDLQGFLSGTPAPRFFVRDSE